MCTTNLDNAVSSYTLYCKSKGLAERTLETYSYALRHLREHLSLDESNPPMPETQDLRTFIQSMLDRGLARGTIRIRMRAIRAFCNFLTREGIIETSPMDDVEIPRVPTR